MKRDDLCDAVRKRLKRLPKPFAAHYGVVPLPPPEQSIPVAAVARQHGEAIAALARVEALAKELADPYLISRILPRREAVSSSAIEGTNSTLDELLSVEETEDDRASDAAKQVRDYALALDDFVPRARQEGPAIFTAKLARELHRTVMQGDAGYQGHLGELRTCVVWIGGGNIAYSTYNPAPPEDIPACLEDSMRYMRGEGMQVMQQSLLTRMAVAHAHFEAVHPFRDGNGRAGRLLLPLMMAAEGHTPLYLSAYIAEHKSAYYAALKAAQQQLAWQDLAGFLSEAVVGTVNELFATRNALLSLRRIWRDRHSFRKGSAAFKAIDILPHYPVLTVKRLAKVAGVSIPAAAAAVSQLAEAGVIEERTGYVRNRVFSAPEALLIINRPFGEEPIVPDSP